MSKLTMCYRDQQVDIESSKNEDGSYRWVCKNFPGVVVEGLDQSGLVDLITAKLDEVFDQQGVASNELELEQEFQEYRVGTS
jgi:hypothetical protein